MSETPTRKNFIRVMPQATAFFDPVETATGAVKSAMSAGKSTLAVDTEVLKTPVGAQLKPVDHCAVTLIYGKTVDRIECRGIRPGKGL